MRNLEGVAPPQVADLISDIIQDKVVCDVGCGEGTFMESLNKYASRVIGIEEEEAWAQTAASKGFEIYNTSSWFEPLPPADVYFLWSKDAMGVYLKAKHEGIRGTFVFGHTVRPSLSQLLSELEGERREIPDSIWWVFITQL